MKDLILVESKTARQQMIGKCSVLDKVKVLPYLTKDMRSTIKQVAEYYDVNEKTIKRIMAKNKTEFSEDGIKIVNNSEASGLFVGDMDVPSKTRRLTLLPKRATLRIGMLLTESPVASLVRNYLLNLEEISSTEQKEWSLERELSKAKRRTMTDAIRDYIADSPNKHWKYKHFTDLVYKKALGASAKELRFERCAKDNDLLRDKLSRHELEAIEKAEVFVAGMVMAGYTYDEIKTKINRVSLMTTGNAVMAQ